MKKAPITTNSKKALRKPFIQQFFRGNLLSFTLAAIASILGAFANLILSWEIQQLVDITTGNQSKSALLQMTIFTAVLIAGCVLMDLITYLSEPRFYSCAMQQYKDYAFGELTKKSISAFTAENTSTYISALSNDANTIEKNYLETHFQLIRNILMFIGAFALMLWYSPLLTLAAFLLSFLPVLASLITGNRLADIEKQVSDRNESFLATLKDSLSGFSVVKSFQAEAAIYRMVSESNKTAEDTKKHRRQVSTIISCIGTVAGISAQLGVFLIGAFLALSGHDISPGILIAFVNLMNFVIQPIATVPGILANRKAAIALIDKLAEALHSNVRSEGGTVCKELTEGIEIKNLSYSYGTDKPVLHDINTYFEAGKSYALVGPSGSGKSTLLNLLMAGSSQYTGEILYDSVELRAISSESLYELVSIIQQNVFVFNSSIRDNITMFHEFDGAETDRAISLSGLDALIRKHGEDYKCGENGNALSGGEKQRISIARSLLRKSPVLLVDEATAALDAETAFHVTNSILNLEGLTRIVVTHALDENLLKKYDGILTLKDGRIVESGTFEELMEKKEFFYSLYTISQ